MTCKKCDDLHREFIDVDFYSFLIICYVCCFFFSIVYGWGLVVVVFCVVFLFVFWLGSGWG